MATKMGSGSAVADASSSGSEVERMMAELGLCEDDMDDVEVDEGAIPQDAVRWMAVARVHIDKTLQPKLVLQKHVSSLGSGSGGELQAVGG